MQHDHATCTLPSQAIETFHRDGVVRVPGIISAAEAEQFRQAALDAAQTQPAFSNLAVFTQLLNQWRSCPVLRELSLHPNIGNVAEQLSGVPMRLWHDQILIKQPHNGEATSFHQDQPYEPLDNAPWSMTAWVALCDVPVERGCMSFIQGAHHATDLPTPPLDDAADFELDDRYFFDIAPDMEWQPRITMPLRAGDCTFHLGYTPHMAGPNATDEPRVAFAVLFVNADAVYTGDKPHPVADAADLAPGQPPLDAMFPPVAAFAAHRAERPDHR